MNNFELIDHEIEDLKENIKKAEMSIDKRSSGTLIVQEGNNRMYWQKKGKDGKIIRIYIAQKDRDKAIRLAQNTYFREILAAMKKELKALMEFRKKYDPNKKSECYEKMSSRRKELVSPLIKPVSMIVEEWQKEEYEANDYHSEKRIHKTDRGEMVRSKSEQLIANRLNKSEILDYRYEKPLYFAEEIYPVYPDFTIINKLTGRVYYLEHAGMMGDAGYSAKFVVKYNKYIRNGLMPGIDIFFTMEVGIDALDIDTLEAIIAVMEQN